MGTGEIIVTSIDKDGSMDGYGLNITRKVAAAVSIPVIASGGAETMRYVICAEEGHASAIAAACIFHFTQQTPLEAKIFLKKIRNNYQIMIRKLSYLNSIVQCWQNRQK